MKVAFTPKDPYYLKVALLLQLRCNIRKMIMTQEYEKGTKMMISLDPTYDVLYQKILLQEELIKDIVKEAQEKGWDDGSFSDRFQKTEVGPLQIAVACEDIEKGLQELICDSEKRYAMLISELLSADPERLSAIYKVAYTFGTKHAVPRNSSPSEAYQFLESIFLDGMPNEAARSLLSSNEASCSWQLLKDPHGSYWIYAGADGSIYYALRKKILEGMFFDTMLSVGQTDENHYEIRKEG